MQLAWIVGVVHYYIIILSQVMLLGIVWENAELDTLPSIFFVVILQSFMDPESLCGHSCTALICSNDFMAVARD